MKQYGFLPELDIVKDEDFIFGKLGGIKDDITLPANESWFDYYSSGEYQYTARFDSYGCVTYSALESIEAILNYKKQKGLLSPAFVAWCKEKGYFNENGEFDLMEQFIAKLSNTDRKGGNTGGEVGNAIRLYGLIPQSLRPYNKNMSKAEYYKEPTKEELALGREWKEWIDFKYERVRTTKHSMSLALRHSPIQVYVYAWLRPVKGIYERTGRTPNHAVSEGKPEWFIRDTYSEDKRFGNDFKRHLAPDFDFHPWAYKYQVLELKKNNMPEKNELVKRVKRVGSNGRGFYIEAMSSDVYVQLSEMFGLDPVLKGVDWDNEPCEGEVVIYDEPVKVAGNWLADMFLRLFKI